MHYNASSFSIFACIIITRAITRPSMSTERAFSTSGSTAAGGAQRVLERARSDGLLTWMCELVLLT